MATTVATNHLAATIADTQVRGDKTPDVDEERYVVEDRSSDTVFLKTTEVVQAVINLNQTLPFARPDGFTDLIKVCFNVTMFYGNKTLQ